MPEITSGEIPNGVMSEKEFFNLEAEGFIKAKEKLEQEMQKVEKMENKQYMAMDESKLRDEKTIRVFEIGALLDSIERLRVDLNVKFPNSGVRGDKGEKIDRALEVSEVEKKAKEYLKKQTEEFEKNGF